MRKPITLIIVANRDRPAPVSLISMRVPLVTLSSNRKKDTSKSVFRRSTHEPRGVPNGVERDRGLTLQTRRKIVRSDVADQYFLSAQCGTHEALSEMRASLEAKKVALFGFHVRPVVWWEKPSCHSVFLSPINRTKWYNKSFIFPFFWYER